VEIISLAMAGGTDPERIFDGKDAVLGYLQPILDNFKQAVARSSPSIGLAGKTYVATSVHMDEQPVTILRRDVPWCHHVGVNAADRQRLHLDA
jgi:hypothetical protein